MKEKKGKEEKGGGRDKKLGRGGQESTQRNGMVP